MCAGTKCWPCGQRVGVWPGFNSLTHGGGRAGGCWAGHHPRPHAPPPPPPPAVSVSAGDTIEFVGVGEDYISWRGGRSPEGHVVLGLSYTNVGNAVKPGR
jgi:hypothetical protein